MIAVGDFQGEAGAESVQLSDGALAALARLLIDHALRNQAPGDGAGLTAGDAGSGAERN